MSTVALDAIFISDAADPSDYITLAYADDTYSLTESKGGGVEGGYASGRIRTWSTAERLTSGQFTFHSTTAEERAWLVDHLRTTVCVRDHHGNKVFGVFGDLPQSFSTLPVGHAAADQTVTLQFQSVSWSEAV